MPRAISPHLILERHDTVVTATPTSQLQKRQRPSLPFAASSASSLNRIALSSLTRASVVTRLILYNRDDRSRSSLEILRWDRTLEAFPQHS